MLDIRLKQSTTINQGCLADLAAAAGHLSQKLPSRASGDFGIKIA